MIKIILLQFCFLLSIYITKSFVSISKYSSLSSIIRYCSASEPNGELDIEILKEELILLCDNYTLKQKEEWAIAPNKELTNESTKKGLFGAESFKDLKIRQNELSQNIIEKINEIEKYNPTLEPYKNWNKPIQTITDECPLNGLWKLRFTTAADATFKPSKRGEAVTQQVANATSGYFLNQISFPNNPGKTKGFVVHVKGIPKTSKEYNSYSSSSSSSSSSSGSDKDRMYLVFEKVEVNRKSKIPSLFGTINFYIPNLLPFFNKFRKKDNQIPGAYFQMMYLDEDLRIHRTGEGNYFVQTKLHEVWDPAHPTGWTTISTL